jgi:hypothetical protein
VLALEAREHDPQIGQLPTNARCTTFRVRT